MFEPKIKINKALYDLLVKQADEKGYSSVEEYATHVLEVAVADAGPQATPAEIEERLKGLGYLK